MAEKIIKTKIALRQETYAYWTKEGVTAPAKKEAGAGTNGYYVPRYGEVCFCEITATSQGTQTDPPTVLFKVGNGTDYFQDLNWASALAADVYDWAKKTETEAEEWLKEIFANTLTLKAGNGLSATQVVYNPATGDKTFTVSHGAKPTSGTAVTGTKGSSAGTFVTGVTIDSYGHIAGINTADVTIPEAKSLAIVDDTTVETPSANTVNVYKNLTASDHTLTEELVQVATAAGVANAIDEYEVFGIDMTTVNALGGIKAGTNLKDKTLHEILNDLLFPYVAPTVGTPARTPSTTSALEKGNTQTVTKVTVTVTKKSKPITNVALYNNSGTKIAEKTGSEVANGGTITFNVNVSVPSTNVTFTVKVTDSDGTVVTSKATSNWSFVYPYYYGVCNKSKTASTLTEAEIEAMTKDIKAKGEKTYTYTTNDQKMVVAYPKAHGVLKKALDPNGFDYLANGFERAELSITGLDGTAQTYYVYVQKDPSFVTSFNMKYQY